MVRKECPGPYATGSGPIDITDAHVIRYARARARDNSDGLEEMTDGMQTDMVRSAPSDINYGEGFEGKGYSNCGGI